VAGGSRGRLDQKGGGAVTVHQDLPDDRPQLEPLGDGDRRLDALGVPRQEAGGAECPCAQHPPVRLLDVGPDQVGIAPALFGGKDDLVQPRQQLQAVTTGDPDLRQVKVGIHESWTDDRLRSPGGGRVRGFPVTDFGDPPFLDTQPSRLRRLGGVCQQPSLQDHAPLSCLAATGLDC